MSPSIRKKVASSLFCSGLVLLAGVSVQAPSWAAKLAQQGYYADFELTLTAQAQTIRAGSTEQIVAHVLGRGPDTAQSATVTLRGDDDLTFDDSSGCDQVSGQTIRCPLPAIDPDLQVSRNVEFNSHPDARGIRVISGFVSSELLPTPTNPGLEVDAAAIDLFGAHTTGIWLLNERPMIESDGRLRWHFLVDNLGPSSMLAGRLVLTAKPGTELTCTAFGNARCEVAPDTPLYLPPTGHLVIDALVPAIVPPESGTELTLALLRDEGVDVGQRPDVAAAAYQLAIFSDSFED